MPISLGSKSSTELMSTIAQLIEIAEYLGSASIQEELKLLQARSIDKRTRLRLPLVGEFSAGKTSLLNAISDAGQLEVATKPTTATIYELHFGADRQYATIVASDGEECEVENLASLKNENLGDTPMVRIYDTSTKVSRDLVLVDTPGISSPDKRHKEVLLRFLPQADALLVVVDCNQQITSSLLSFIEEATLVGRKTYMLVTKCDTKHPDEIKGIKEYIAKNSKLPVECIVCVSAQTGDLDEFYALLEHLMATKQEILAASIQASIVRIQQALLLNLETLLKLPNDSKGLEETLGEVESRKRQCECEIKNFIRSVEELSHGQASELTDRYESLLRDRLEVLASKKSASLTDEANTVLASTGSYILAEYKQKVSLAIQDTSKRSSTHIQQAVSRLDLSALQVGARGFDIDLAEVGHSWDRGIATLVKEATVAVSRSCGLPGAIGPIVVSSAEGMLESLVSGITEYMHAKPRRQKLIRDTIEMQFVPEFRQQMQDNSRQLLYIVETSLQEASEAILHELSAQVQELKDSLEASSNSYQERMRTIRQYKQLLEEQI